jgi:hypothetical protein
MMLTIYDICLFFIGTDNPTGDSYPYGYEYGGKFIPTSEYRYPMRLFFIVCMSIEHGQIGFIVVI